MNEQTKSALREMGTMLIIAVALGAALMWAIVVGTGRSENAECIKWSQEADAYPGFFLAQWQFDQCSAHGIKIDAPVK